MGWVGLGGIGLVWNGLGGIGLDWVELDWVGQVGSTNTTMKTTN